MVSKTKKPEGAEPQKKADATELPEVPGAQLQLHWADFKKLLERRNELAGAKPAPRPPVEWALGAVACEGEVVAAKPGFVSLQASFDLKVLATGWVQVPLVEGELAISQATADGAPLLIDPEEDSPRQAWVQGPAEKRVQLQLEIPLATESDQSGFQLSFPGAPVVELALLIGRGGLDIQVEGGLLGERKEKDGQTRLKATVPGGGELQVAWTRAKEVVKDKPVEPPQLFVRTESFIAVGDGMARGNHTFALNILRSPLSKVEIEVPSDATVADVKGPMVGGWEATLGQKGEPQRVRVELRSEFKGNTAFVLQLDRPWDDTPPIKLPLCRVKGAERESGFVAVAAMTSVELAQAEAVGLVRVDLKELPPALAARMPYPVVLGYKFREGGIALSVTAQRHADLPVVTAMADTAEHTVLQTVDGKRITRASYRIRNAQRQFVRLMLPPGATVWSTLIDGQAVKPAQGQAGEVLIPLKKAQSFGDTERAFEVEVVTMTEGAALGERGTLQVTLPRCDLPVGALRFSLWLPEGFLYDDFVGTLEEVRGFRDPWSPEGTVSQAMQHVTPPKQAPLGPPPTPTVEEVHAPPPPPPPRTMIAQAQSASMAPMVGGQGYGAMNAGPKLDKLEAREAQKGKKVARRDRASTTEKERVMDGMDMDESEESISMDDMPYQAQDEAYGSMDLGLPGGIQGFTESLARLGAPRDAGVLPVRMQVPEKGLCFAFERLLVLDEPLNVQTEYSREKRGD